jgi:hypothetical protein
MSDPDIVYYNLSISQNTVNTGSLMSVPAIVNANNTIPIINVPSNFYGSIIKLVLPLFNCPIGYFDPNSFGAGANQGIYYFSMTCSGFISNQPVVWIPEDNTVPQPPLNPDGQTYGPSKYYFMYDYQNFINCWNNALTACYTALKGLVPSLPDGGAPFFYFNPNTQIIQLFALQSLFDANGANKIQLYCNTALTPYISGFQYISNSDPLLTNQFVIASNPSPTLALNIQQIPATMGQAYILVQQEYPNLVYWNMLSNVNVLTNMSIVQEGYYLGQGSTMGTSNLLLQSTLTDFTPDLTNGIGGAGVASSTFIYTASALYRLFCITQNTGLYNISLSITFTDRNGNDWPLELFTNGQSASIKFMFIKKNLIKTLMNAKI